MSLANLVWNRWSRFTAWVWTVPGPDEPRRRSVNLVKAFLRIHYIFIREIHHDRITLRASALTFTIVLSLVPVLALGTAVLKGLGGGNQMRQAAYRFIAQIEEGPSIPSVEVEEENDTFSESTATTPTPTCLRQANRPKPNRRRPA